MEKSIRQVGFASSHLGHYVCDALERIKRIVEEVSRVLKPMKTKERPLELQVKGIIYLNVSLATLLKW